jgi:hypothetical protein
LAVKSEDDHTAPDLRDDAETAAKLFPLVNIIADVMITQPKHVQEMYTALMSGPATPSNNETAPGPPLQHPPQPALTPHRGVDTFPACPEPPVAVHDAP